MSAIHQKDAYKIAHAPMYPDNTTFLYSNFTARSGKNSNIPDSKGVTFIGLQYVLIDYFINEWNDTFFNKPKEEVVGKYKRRVTNIVGDVDVSHIEALHDLGYLPIEIKALPEGSFVPYNVPMITIKNTHPDFFWVTNMIESVLSAELWQPITSATTYMAYKKLAHQYAELTGSDKGFIPYQLHDFSFRGMSSRQAAAKSGFAILASGSLGTDSIPAVDLAEDYYGANADEEIIGTSIKGSEHSIMCAGTKEGELETYRRLITKVVPDGMVALVSDTWDFWKVVTEYLVELKPEIMARDGKLVIRPDSGDPVDIICGKVFNIVGENHIEYPEGWMEESLYDYVTNDTPHGEMGVDEYSDTFKVGDKYIKATLECDWNRYDKQYYYIDDSRLKSTEEFLPTAEDKGLIETLWDIFGGTINEAGYKVLDSHIGAIYGDSITYDRARQIFKRLEKKGFASSNIVLGIGSYTYQMVSRDTHGFAMKATFATINGEGVEIFKDPVTDSGIKKSAKGLLMVDKIDGEFVLIQQVTEEQEQQGYLETVFKDGILTKRTTLKEIRAITNEGV